MNTDRLTDARPHKALFLHKELITNDNARNMNYISHLTDVTPHLQPHILCKELFNCFSQKFNYYVLC
jgi:hypothetical protein